MRRYVIIMSLEQQNAMETRNEGIYRLKSEVFDVLIVGGGITGAGIARDAILRGYSVGLIEKNDFASGTSSGSSKLVHAGLRYVAQKEFGLVREASIERKKILEMAPHATRPLKFLIPLHSDYKTNKFNIRLAMWLYDILANFRNYTFHKIIGPEKARALLPSPVREENFQGVALYGDGQMDDARLTLDIILSAEEHGAVVMNYCEASSFKENSDNMYSVLVSDKLDNNIEFQIKAKSIVLSCGHWTDELIKNFDSTATQRVRPTKGIHIITQRFYNKDYAVVAPVEDGRIIFLVPFGEYLLIGTTDTDYTGDFDYIPVQTEDIEYLIQAINTIFPGTLKEEDILSAYSGLRPLILPVDAKSESDVSRKHEIYELKPNVMAIAGGKYTTYRAMAKELVDRLDKFFNKKNKCVTDKVPLFGWVSTSRKNWEDWTIVAIENMTIRHELPQDVATHLLVYGKNYSRICEKINESPELSKRIAENRSYILAEINYMIEIEKARTLNDIMLRRTQIQLSANQGLDCVDTVANQMARILGWDTKKLQEEIQIYKNSLVWKA